MAAVIGNDILDIGSAKNRKQQEGFVAPSELTLGRPGQFDVPNVADVRFKKAFVGSFLAVEVCLRLLLTLLVCFHCLLLPL